MEALARTRKQSEDKKISVLIYKRWYPATVLAHENDKIEFSLDEPVVVEFPRKPFLGIFRRKPVEFPYLPKGHRRTIHARYTAGRLLFQ